METHDPDPDAGAAADPVTGQATRLLRRLHAGDGRAADELLPLFYAELRAIAERAMRHQPAGHTLQPTALVNEAYVRLFGGAGTPEWNDRAHFVRVAARAMRNVLVDHARARRTQKRGEGERPLPLDGLLEHFERQDIDPVELSDVLDKLARLDGELGRIVELRFFAGLTIEETARVLGVSTPTVERGWRVARMWLRDELLR